MKKKKQKKGKGQEAPLPPAASQRSATPPTPPRTPAPPSESEYETDELHRQQRARRFTEFEIATGRDTDSLDYARWEKEKHERRYKEADKRLNERGAIEEAERAARKGPGPPLSYSTSKPL